MNTAERLALVTGTSSGVGAAVAQQLIGEGWTVVGLSRRPTDILDPRYRHFQVDLGDLAQLKETARRELGPIVADPRWTRVGLVNNAGAIGSLRALEESDPASVANLYVVNAVAPIFLMGFVIRSVSKATPLRIVNLSTGAATRAIPGLGDYGSSKAALRLAGMVLAEELASPERPGGARGNVGILSYAPGVVDTPMQVAARAERPWNRLFIDFHEQGKLVAPELPAREIVEFLEADDASGFVERRFGT